MTRHPLCAVRRFEILEGYVLRVAFDDGSEQTIDLEPVLAGELYGPLRDRELFRAVRLDPEATPLVWPNGADFDPATLHDWPAHAGEIAERARAWAASTRPTGDPA